MTSTEQFVVAFNTNEGNQDSWFAAMDEDCNQVFGFATAEGMAADLVENSSSKGVPIITRVVNRSRQNVTVNPRNGYVRVGKFQGDEK